MPNSPGTRLAPIDQPTQQPRLPGQGRAPDGDPRFGNAHSTSPVLPGQGERIALDIATGVAPESSRPPPATPEAVSPDAALRPYGASDGAPDGSLFKR